MMWTETEEDGVEREEKAVEEGEETATVEEKDEEEEEEKEEDSVLWPHRGSLCSVPRAPCIYCCGAEKRGIRCASSRPGRGYS